MFLYALVRACVRVCVLSSAKRARVVLLVLVFFSFGTPCAIAYLLYQRRAALYDDDGKPKPQPLDILYAIYAPHAYWYEPVQLVFKLLLWSALVFFDHGSEMQLATALVVNVLQLCFHVRLYPMVLPTNNSTCT